MIRINITPEQRKRIDELLGQTPKQKKEITTPEQRMNIERIIDKYAEEGRISGIKKSEQLVPAYKIDYPHQYTFHIDVKSKNR